ncbi:MAG: type VI secretion system tip protein TssI/VgrG [Polyangiaceae bacterium]
MTTRAPEPRSGNLTLTVASGDALDVREFTIREGISSLFHIQIVAVSPQANLDFEGVVGLAGTFELGGSGGTPQRRFHGVVTSMEQIVVEDTGLSTFRVTLEPSLWLTSQRRNYRIHQQLPSVDVVQRTLRDDWNLKATVRLRRAYKPRPYSVQYAETDFAFVSRLLEDAGVAFYFDFQTDQTELVLSDCVEQNPASPLAFKKNSSGSAHTTLRFATAVEVRRAVRPGRYVMRDHDFRRPADYALLAEAKVASAGVEARLERYHHVPGAFLFGATGDDATPVADDRGRFRADQEEGARLAEKRLGAQRGAASTVVFRTNAHDLAPGAVVSIQDHPRSDINGRPLIIIESTIRGTSAEDWIQSCTAQVADRPYFPPLLTPKPRALGVESATVVGPAGEEIHTDEFGRVRVHFHWDRYGKMDDSAGSWVHVSQTSAGSGFGGMQLPRVGQEVLVDFLGGDPDRPIIVGRVYTALQPVPYKLPDNKTQSGWRSQTSPGGGGYNEIMFEDAAGQELVNIQAQKDLSKLVKNNEDVVIGNNLDELIKNDRTETVGKNTQVVVGVNRATQIGAVDELRVGTKLFAAISGDSASSGTPTSITMVDKEIVLDTGAGATIRMKGAEIQLKAEKIEIVAEKELLVKTEKGDTKILGGPMVKVNC